MTDVERLERLAHRMDKAFRIPFTNIRLGWDSVLGLLPGIGDAAALAPAVYIINESRKLSAPAPLIGRMAFNTGVDTLLGTIPLIGDIFDIGVKSNTRNVTLLKEHLDTKKAA